MGERTGDQFPVLQSRRNRSKDQKADEERRVLWRAFRHGSLSEEEFASILERLEFAHRSAGAYPEFAFTELSEQ